MIKCSWAVGLVVLAVGASARGDALYVGPADGPWDTGRPLRAFADPGIGQDRVGTSTFSRQELSGFCFLHLAGPGEDGQADCLPCIPPGGERLGAAVEAAAWNGIAGLRGLTE